MVTDCRRPSLGTVTATRSSGPRAMQVGQASIRTRDAYRERGRPKIGGSNLDPPEEDNLPSRGSRIDRHPPAVPHGRRLLDAAQPLILGGMTSLPDNLPDISSGAATDRLRARGSKRFEDRPKGRRSSALGGAPRARLPLASGFDLGYASTTAPRNAPRAVTAPVRLAVFLCPPVPAGCVA